MVIIMEFKNEHGEIINVDIIYEGDNNSTLTIDYKSNKSADSRIIYIPLDTFRNMKDKDTINVLH